MVRSLTCKHHGCWFESGSYLFFLGGGVVSRGGHPLVISPTCSQHQRWTVHFRSTRFSCYYSIVSVALHDNEEFLIIWPRLVPCLLTGWLISLGVGSRVNEDLSLRRCLEMPEYCPFVGFPFSTNKQTNKRCTNLLRRSRSRSMIFFYVFVVLFVVLAYYVQGTELSFTNTCIILPFLYSKSHFTTIYCSEFWSCLHSVIPLDTDCIWDFFVCLHKMLMILFIRFVAVIFMAIHTHTVFFTRYTAALSSCLCVAFRLAFISYDASGRCVLLFVRFWFCRIFYFCVLYDNTSQWLPVFVT